MSGNLFARSTHDLTAAAWFGGSLMGAIGLNGATAQANDPRERTRLSSLGWKKWAPFQAAALLAHLVADYSIAWKNKGRIMKQDSVSKLTMCKTAATLTGAGVTLWAALEGRKVDRLADEGAEGATEPSPDASETLKKAQKRLKFLQWLIPLFASTVIVLGAKHGEMQRPKNVLKGLLK